MKSERKSIGIIAMSIQIATTKSTKSKSTSQRKSTNIWKMSHHTKGNQSKQRKKRKTRVPQIQSLALLLQQKLIMINKWINIMENIYNAIKTHLGRNQAWNQRMM
jgi:hypothetical protein